MLVSVTARRVIVVGALLCACGPGTRGGRSTVAHEALRGLPPPSDRPYDLQDDGDLRDVREQYDLLAVGAEGRSAQRVQLADAYVRRIERSFDGDDRATAYDWFLEMIGLWRPDELSAGAPDLAPYAPVIERIRVSYARSGGDAEAVVALLALRAAAPERRDALDAELALILQYVDDLAIAHAGEGARHARPIKLLENGAGHVPTGFAVSRLTALYLERQAAIDTLFRGGGGPDMGVLSEHGEGLFRTTWNIVRFHARAGRLAEALPIVGELRGVGDDAGLRGDLASALATGAPAAAWVSLARHYIDSDPGKSDLDAALAICRAGLAAHPDDPGLHAIAGAISRDQNHLARALHSMERAYQLDPTDRDVANALAALYAIRVERLAQSERPDAARARLAELEAFHAEAARRFDDRLDSDLADAYAGMGRGLLGLGEVDAARGYLERSLKLRADYASLEYLGTIDLKRHNYQSAIGYFERALVLPADDITDHFVRGKLRRLLGDAYRGAGQADEATGQYRRAVEEWEQLDARYELTPRASAEVLIEVGKLYWALGERDAALGLFETAIDIDPQTESTYADVVAFLAVRDRYAAMADAYHRALGTAAIGDYFKVYMSLWLLAAGRRAGVPDDPLALDYLRSRHGTLWHDRLAQLAIGATTFDALWPHADNRGRRAELFYYAAVLGDAPAADRRKLLDNVLATDMLTFFEYDMAALLLASERYTDPR